MTRPHRQKKGDRLIHPGATTMQVRCDFALAPFDRAALDAERTWGIDRLASIVSPVTAERYGRAIAHLNACIEAEDPDATAAAAGNCIRGLAAMDQEARAAGHVPPSVEAWEIEVDGKRGFLIRDADLWPKLAAIHPGATIWTLGEVSAALKGLGDLVVAAKAAFEGAQVTAVRPRTEIEADLNDEIPW